MCHVLSVSLSETPAQHSRFTVKHLLKTIMWIFVNIWISDSRWRCCAKHIKLSDLKIHGVVFWVALVSSVVSQGYRIRLGSSTDKKDTGRLHVDFAQARDDLYEWECRQRMMAREERHRRKMEEDRLRPPSPPPIVHFSEHECSQLGDKIKGSVLSRNFV